MKVMNNRVFKLNKKKMEKTTSMGNKRSSFIDIS